MWSLSNHTPFAAERSWVRDAEGAETWLIAVKGSFVIGLDGTLTLKEKQDPVYRAPVFRGEPGNSSLIAESDLIHTKPGTDVLVEGHAFAPGGFPAERITVRLQVGRIDKTLHVWGDRELEGGFAGVRASAPQRALRVPITWERSYGGTDIRDKDARNHGWEPRNPVGVGYAVHSDHVTGSSAPSVEYPHAPFRGTTRGEPAGLGPIARHWQPRIKLAGTYDQHWQQGRMPLLPSDFDERFYHAAPLDQQVPGYLRGGERVSLANMVPEGLLAFELPRVVLAFSTRLGRERIDHRATLHTVHVLADQRQVNLVWHTSLRCHGKDHKLYETTIREKVQTSLSGVAQGRGRW